MNQVCRQRLDEVGHTYPAFFNRSDSIAFPDITYLLSTVVNPAGPPWRRFHRGSMPIQHLKEFLANPNAESLPTIGRLLQRPILLIR
jgi:hypothetical protein